MTEIDEKFIDYHILPKYNKSHISNLYDYNSHKQISILTPFRGAPLSLIDMVSNFFGLSSHPEKIEMLIRIDDDQEDLYKLAQNNKIVNLYNIKIYSGERYGYINMHKYLHDLISMSVGNIIFCCGEGQKFLDTGWDEELYFYVDKVSVLYHRSYYYDKDNIMKEYIQNQFNNEMSIITRKLYDIIGRFSPALCTDIYWHYVGGYSGIIVRTNIRMIRQENIPVYSKEDKMKDIDLSDAHMSSARVSEEIIMDANKVVSYLNSNNIPRKKVPEVYFGNNIEHSNGFPVIDIQGGERKEYLVEFINKDDNSIIYSLNLLPYNWAICYPSTNIHHVIGRVSSQQDGVFFEQEIEI